MRVLGGVKSSILTKESISVERQQDLIQQWAQANRHIVVAWAEDTEVSGSVSPFDASELSQYFEEPLKDTWDILCSWKLDRIVGTSTELHKLVHWLQTNNKQLVCVAGDFDLSSWKRQFETTPVTGIDEADLEVTGSRIRSGRKDHPNIGSRDGGLPTVDGEPVPIQGSGARTAAFRDILKCWHCDSNMHIKRTKMSNGKTNTSYRCSKGCKQISVNSDVLTPIVYRQFEHELGCYYIMEREYLPPTVSLRQLEEAKATHAELVKHIAKANSDEDRQHLFQQLTVVSKRIEELRSVEATENTPNVIWKETNRRYIDEWNDLDEEGKRLLLIRSGITVRANQLTKGTKAAPGTIEVEIIIPEDLKKCLRGQNPCRG